MPQIDLKKDITELRKDLTAFQTHIEEKSSNGVINTTAIGEATIKLDGSFDFDIQISSSGTLDGGKVYLIGYQS